VQGPAEEEAAEGGQASTVAAEDIGLLRDANYNVSHRLTLQVDSVCQLVGNIEDLLDRTNEATREVQKQYHSQRFKAFPHFNSPARLIKAIVSTPKDGGE